MQCFARVRCVLMEGHAGNHRTEAPPIQAPVNLVEVAFTKARCQEASPLSRDSFIPCGAPGHTVVYHQREGRAYVMCAPCASHNVRNRGGIELVPRQKEV